MILFLVGYMGSGKSTIGRALAKRTGFRFVDMDKEIERKCGMTIPEIFASQGERFFRERESSLIKELCSRVDGDGETDAGSGEEFICSDTKAKQEKVRKSVVIATGGGVPCFSDNMEMMNRVGTTIYLKMSPEGLATRLYKGRKKRPLIKDMDDGCLLKFIAESLTARKEFYERSLMTIDCDGVSDKYICAHIEEMIVRSEADLI